MTRYNNLVKQASQTPAHEPTDDEIITNSSINLHPTQAQSTESQAPLHLPTVSQAITRLLNESKAAQSWYIQQIQDLNLNLQSQKNFTNEYARKVIPSPPDGLLYTPGTIAASRRIIADKAEAYRIMVSWGERRDIYNELQEHPEGISYEDFKTATGRKYLKRNLFDNIKRMKKAPSLPVVSNPRIPLGKTDKQYTLIAIHDQDILLCGLPLKLDPRSDVETRVDLFFRLPDRFMRNHQGAVHTKLTRPTIYLDDHGEPTFSWTIQEWVKQPAVKARDAESCVGVDCGKTNFITIARVHRDGRYTGGFTTSKATRKSRRTLDRRRAEMGRVTAKQARREVLAGKGKTTLSPERAARFEAHRESLAGSIHDAWESYEWDVTADVMAFTAPGEPVAVEDLKFNKGGALHFRFSGFQDKLEHRCALTGHDFVRVQAKGTSSACPDCSKPLGDREEYHDTECSGCAWSGDRDASAAVSIARRGLRLSKRARLDRAHEGQKRVLRSVRRGPKGPGRPARDMPRRCDRKSLPCDSGSNVVRGSCVGGASAYSTGDDGKVTARCVTPTVGLTPVVITRLFKLLR